MSHVASADRRRQLVEAAMTVIGREGVRQATTRRIAAEAQAPLATLHYTFKNKHELFEAVVQHCQHVSFARFHDFQDAGDDLEATLRAFLREFAEWARQGTEWHLAQYELFLWAMREPGRESLALEIFAGHAEFIATMLAASAGSDITDCPSDVAGVFQQLAHDLLAIADGMVLQMLARKQSGPGDADIDRYVRMLLSTVDPAVVNRAGAPTRVR